MTPLITPITTATASAISTAAVTGMPRCISISAIDQDPAMIATSLRSMPRLITIMPMPRPRTPRIEMLRKQVEKVRDRGKAVQREAEHDQQCDRDHEDDLFLIGLAKPIRKRGEALGVIGELSATAISLASWELLQGRRLRWMNLASQKAPGSFRFFLICSTASTVSRLPSNGTCLRVQSHRLFGDAGFGLPAAVRRSWARSR